MRELTRRLTVAVTAVLVLPSSVEAQSQSPVTAPSSLDVLAGSELEMYLRALQVAGLVKLHPWGIRSFSPREVTRLLQTDSGSGPWQLSTDRLVAQLTPGGMTLRTVLNSSYPHGANDGAVWAGRGLTVSASAGFTFRAGPLSIMAAPTAFVSQNASFSLLDNGQTGVLAYNDGLFPLSVDRPQRFGDDAYGRIDPGTSGIRVDTRFITAGLGTFPMLWGPATEHPFIVGTNAPAMPHFFIGTGAPVYIGIGHAHARLIWGRLAQSDYSPVTGSDRFLSDTTPGRARLAAGAALVFVPRGVPGLELGLTHFAHVPFRPEGMDSFFWRSAFPDVLFKKRLYATVGDSALAESKNELASLFARWVFPGAGFEIYGEHGHDDWYNDFRDLVQEPEHNRSYMIGFQKTFSGRAPVLSVLRGELMSHQMSHLARDRPGQGAVYTHFILRQGHTHRGQLLGASAGVGSAAGSLLAWDRYTATARTTFTWRRIVRAQRGNFAETGIRDPNASDVLHSLGAEHARPWRQFRLTAGLEVMREFNRNFGDDAGNVSALVMLTWLPRLAPTR